ncbi:TetR/AcrR family transcriptional regulator [Thalassospira marina]|uniref:TetR family transcriptional regulator n=1 Tax=Thalassospira marina TaxID=2048283 RepID=A0A2N3KTT6_9PROT|nr:TetR/AcrR family transcriptional regulator [Thalassospira marina]AUG55826.1 TetR family transcriptional regulator [Thalassospira marina]PKR53952.1 TetR family transcriptional regulator [Thalassospira marina]
MSRKTEEPTETPQKPSPTVDGRLLRGEATRDRVLDAAERCFAKDGFDGISIRQVASEAEVTLGVVGFHGGSKNELFRTVLARRVDALSAARRARLKTLQETPDAITIEAIVDAYITPYLEYASGGDPQWRAYAKLIARVSSDDRYYPHIRELYDPVALEFMDALEKLCPGVSRETLATLLTLSVASLLSIVASRWRISGLAGTNTRPPAAITYRDTIVSFCAGGIRAAMASETGTA